ncbi:MAG: GDSL-type esterase/lipase family protein [Fuerstiella sp.]|nr:GDSL-type esterase/lipase family protein [Fuerstiella sp.]
MKPVLIAALLTGIAIAVPRPLIASALILKKGDHICLVGNELGERMQHHNYWEALLHQSYPDLELTVRNLCFPGDEPYERIRSLDFGDPDSHLKHSRASVVMFFFGFNESFAGRGGLDEFTGQMTKLVTETLAQKYNGTDHPRVVLVSPIAFEDTDNRNLPDGNRHNIRLSKYTAALKSVAEQSGVAFADIYTPSKRLFQESSEQLTLNGSHLNDAGYQALASLLMNALGLTATESVPAASLKSEIDDKNFHWWHRYRAVNGYSIYGKRGLAGSDGTYNNRDVMERERAILDQMTVNRDKRIWAIAQGQSVSDQCNDTNTLPFLEVRTNVGGEDDPNRKRGKLGALDYLPAAEQQKLFRMADGYVIQLVASEEDFPELANPVALNFDNRGRLWVTTMPSYPHWQPKHRLEDKILILSDVDADGRADDCTVFADGLHQPTGFEIGYGGAFVAQQPDILFLQDTDGDNVADVRIRRLVGFDTADSHHGLAAFEWGPGGSLYFNEGTFKYSQVESPYGLTRMHEAGVWRYNPRTHHFNTHVSLAFANPWGHVYDRWGQDFVSDASSGFNYWGTPVSGEVAYPAKHAGGAFNDTVNNFKDPALRGRDVCEKFIEKRTRPSAGSEIVSSRHFKPEDQGDFLLCNVIGDRSVLQHSMNEAGSGFEGIEKTPLVFCEDGNFRPIDIQFAPDGTLYICDWHNALIGHLQHNLREPNRDHQHGRIWRVICRGRNLVQSPVIADQSIPMLLDALKEYEDRTRYRARRELASRPTAAVVAVVQTWTAALDTSDKNYAHHLLEANWVLQSHNVIDAALLNAALNSEDYHCRAAATRILCDMRDHVPDALTRIRDRIRDDHPRVRLEAVRACSFFDREDAIEVALEVLEDDMDSYLQYTLDETMRHLESQ